MKKAEKELSGNQKQNTENTKGGMSKMCCGKKYCEKSLAGAESQEGICDITS